MSHGTIGRLAPSPTGAQHVGNARTYLLAWLLCRRQRSSKLLLRIEDLETPRIKSWAVEQIYEDLAWLGLDWDRPILPEEHKPSSKTVFQSHRTNRYREIVQTLLARELVYPCTCSRSEIELAAAPHESQLDGQIYPGTCKINSSEDAGRLEEQGIPFSLRFRVRDEIMKWHDEFFGDQELNVAASLGDFVVWRNDGSAAYQLAVVVDDHDFGVNQVVRGADLIYSTYRQRAIYDALGWNAPSYIHVPLVVGPDGKRLAKRHGDTRLSFLRDEGVSACQLVGFLAWKSRMISEPRAVMPQELLDLDPLANLPIQPLAFCNETDVPFLKSIKP
jgi:glutamyl-tRNA synthetase